MDSNCNPSDWRELSFKIRQTWGDLNDDELNEIREDSTRLPQIVQQKYGLNSQEVERQIKEFEMVYFRRIGQHG